MDTLPIYGISWEDAHGSDGTIFPHEIDHRPYVFTTVGYLIRSDATGVTIAAELGEDGKVRDCTFIPRKMILKEFPIVPVKNKRKSRAKKVDPPLSTPSDPTPT